MFLKNQHKKINDILLIIFISNLVLGGLFLVPIQIQAAYSCNSATQTCHSCNSAGQCVEDENGPYTCSLCFGRCESSSPSSGSCTGSSYGQTNPTNILNILSDVGSAAGSAEDTKETLIDIILQSGKIPENLKPWLIGAINENANISAPIKEQLIDIIQKDGIIPGNLKSLLISTIEDYQNITELIQNEILSLIMGNIVDINYICKTLAEIVAPIAVFGTTIGTPIAIAITTLCPKILHEALSQLGYYGEKLKTGESIQTIISPTLNTYQWEVGIPGFIKPGEITEF